jgi:hypothetical protein
MKYSVIAYLFASIIFSVFFYAVSFRPEVGDDKIFLTISTFFFAILAGFFIARQGDRYSAIRDKMTTLDGSMSFIYRSLGHFGPSAQKEGGKILKSYYSPILKNRSWNYSFTHKTTILTDLHALFEKLAKGKNITPIQNGVINQAMVALRESQLARKNIVALKEEHVPLAQWILMSFLGLLLVIAISAIPSYTGMMVSFLKGAFAGITIFILVILRKLDRLEFFEGIIGENSAKDVLSIIKGER